MILCTISLHCMPLPTNVRTKEYVLRDINRCHKGPDIADYLLNLAAGGNDSDVMEDDAVAACET